MAAEIVAHLSHFAEEEEEEEEEETTILSTPKLNTTKEVGRHILEGADRWERSDPPLRQWLLTTWTFPNR